MMASPTLAASASPIYTPAALQGELPPWAHPTPSPSPLIRCPAPDTSEAGSAGGASPAAPVVPQEFLWIVCRPFIEQMLMALQRAIQQQIEHAASASPDQPSSETAARRPPTSAAHAAAGAGTSPLLPGRKAPPPFRSLFNPTPTIPRRPGEAPSLPEETSPSDHDSCPTPTGSASQGTAARSEGRSMPQKVAFSLTTNEAETRSGRSTKSNTPVQNIKEPPQGSAQEAPWSAVFGDPTAQGAPQKVAENAAMRLSAAGGPGNADEMATQQGGGAHGVLPLYLTWSQQHGSGQRWADQRLSPTVSPVAPRTAPMVPGMQGMQGMQDASSYQPQLVLALSSDNGAAAADAAEKSVMVCRHWKSKGFCRMEDQCKFLHPEHKRGTAAPPPKGSASGAAGGGAITTTAAPGTTGGGAAKTGGSTKSSSRRSGRHKNSGSTAAAAGGGGGAAVGVAGGSPGSGDGGKS
eukprot:gnl/TRDRNA2_/TRDRNA2_147065_c1_seq1.p1 gnl/TRDRNA2_/TRDRNA2_147065_c1~~gnl/TRDRNA2_/TRDRNA2_147065_c1_seq1.p1  ORF type:complete len:464 (-),score=63.90 gnl/TRDRNA2_/TRDRNA2_147065_c1_seq1:138-1529(-)